MSTLFGGSHARASQPDIPIPEAALRMTTSVQGKARPIGWGRNRLGANVIWIGDFKPYLVANYTPPTATSAGGKGGGARSQQQGSITYTWNYLINAAFSICEGPIDSVVAVNSNNSWTSWAAAPDLTGTVGPNKFGAGNFAGPLLYATLFPGSQTQNPPGQMTSLHPDQALAYRGEAYLFFYPLLLGTSVSIPQMSFDVIFGHLCGLTNFPFEAYAGDVIYDYLTNAEYGVPGYTTDLVETPTLFNTFCGANSLLVSPVVTDQVEGSSFISDLLEATHAAIFMSGGVLRIRPYAEADASANGVTFTHDATPIYDLEPQDFLPGPNGTDPIDINRKQPQDISNNLRIEYLDRDNSYAPTVYETRDEASITAYGIERSSDVRNQHFFCRKECASVAAALQLQREQVTTTYTFNLPREFELLDPMDLLTLPLDKYGKGQARQPVRIIEIVERDDYSFTITAEEYLGTADMPTYSRQDTTHNLPDFNKAAPSVNTPVIFELPTLISGDLKVYTGLSGADPDNWGGAEIWASFDDVHYIKVDTVYGSSRMGVTESTLPDKAAPAPPTINIDTALINVSPAIAAAASGPNRDTALISVSPRTAAVPIGPYRDTSLLSAHPAIAAAVATAWNPAAKYTGISLSADQLTASLPSALSGPTDVNVRGTLSGIANRYCELMFTGITTGLDHGAGIGLVNASAPFDEYPGHNTNSSGYFYNGFYKALHSSEQGFTATWGLNDILGILLLATSAKFFINGSLALTISQIPSGPNFPVVSLAQPGDTCIANFGQSPFAFLPPGVGAVGWNA